MSRKAHLPPVPLALADVALIDGPTIAAAGGMSLSSWHEFVRLKQAPQPVIRAPRCTRWKLADVRDWLIQRAAQGAETEASRTLIATAHRASKAAQTKREAKRAKAAAPAGA